MTKQQKEEYLLDTKKPELLSRKSRLFIFLILFILSNLTTSTQIIINQHKKSVDDSRFKEKFSIFHSIGGILGEFLFIFISLLENRRNIIFICVILNGILYLVYSFINNYSIFYFLIFFIGIIKNYLHILAPAWIDQFGIKKYKTILMYIYLSNIFVSYIINLILLYNSQSNSANNNWYLNLIIIGILILIFGFLLLLFPKKYFSLHYNYVGYKLESKEGTIVYEKNDRNNGRASFFADNNNKNGFLKTIIKNKVYIFSVLTSFFYIFVFQIVNIDIIPFTINKKYWEPMFELKLGGISAIGEFFGIFIGGIFLLCQEGGYENKKSGLYFGVFVILLYLSSLIMAFANKSWLFCVGFFLYKFSSKPLSYINIFYVINCIPNLYKGSGLSLYLLFKNISRIITTIFNGFLHDKLDKISNTLPMKIILNLNIFVLIFGLLLAYYRYNENKDKENDEINQNNEKELQNIENI